MKFLHIADIHIGFRQYNHQQRFEDFGIAFAECVELAIDEEVDVCLIAGDLFHKASIDPETLLQAETSLAKLAHYQIQTLVIAGNHDRPRYGQRTTWLDYLAKREIITLLESRSDDFVVENESYIDLDGIRFIGMPWYGGSTKNVLERIIEELSKLSWDDIYYSVMLAHTAIEGQMPHMPEMLKHSDLAPLKKYVDYLALGHLHKPYKYPDDEDSAWIFNPGAIENNTFDEAEYREKGAYLVEVNKQNKVRPEMRIIQGRPFHKIPFSITKFHEFASLTDALRERVKKEAIKWGNSAKPVVSLVLSGNLNFDRSQLKIERLREIIEENADCLLVRVTSHLETLGRIGDYDEEIGVEELERLVFADIARESGHGEQAEIWGHYLQQTKNSALANELPEQLYDAFVNHLETLDQQDGDE